MTYTGTTKLNKRIGNNFSRRFYLKNMLWWRLNTATEEVDNDELLKNKFQNSFVDFISIT